MCTNTHVDKCWVYCMSVYHQTRKQIKYKTKNRTITDQASLADNT